MKNIDLDLHKYPAAIRFQFLDLLGVSQKNEGIPSDGLNIVTHHKDIDTAGLKKRTIELFKLPYSEGNVTSRADGPYELTSGRRPYTALKFHNSSTLTAKCTSSKESKTKGVWNLHWSILSGKKYGPFKEEDIIKKGNETYIKGGTTFSTRENPVGKNILLEFENFNLTENKDKDHFKISAWSPRFIEVTNDKVDTVEAAVDRATKDMVFQGKVIVDKKTIYLKEKEFDSFGEIEIFAEGDDKKEIKSVIKVINEIEKLRIEAEKYPRSKQVREDYKKLKEKIKALEGKIIAYMEKKGITSQVIGATTISLRTVPTWYEIMDNAVAVESLKKKGLEKFILEEPFNMRLLREFLNEKENEKLKLDGIEKRAFDQALYIYKNYQEGDDIAIDDLGFDSFYEMEGYDPVGLSNNVLADDWRLTCAYYSTLLKVGEDNFKFSLKQVLDVARKIVVEIKERVKAGKMTYSFNLKDMKKTSKALYMKTRLLLKENLQNIGEK